MKGFLLDLNKCNGCHSCQIVCKDEHCDQPWLPYSEAQPQVGQFWMRVEEKERGQVPLVRVSYTPIMCHHCQDAPCIAAAPEGVFEKREDGLIILKPVELEPEVAQRIADACPIGAIFVNDEKHIAQKCNGCAHLLDDTWDVPRCVDACCVDALLYDDIENFGEDWERATPVSPELNGANTLVRYLNLPKRFMGGTIIDSEKDEVIIGADVKIRRGTDFEDSMKTNDFGDWLFDQIEPAEYVVEVDAEGYSPQSFEVDLRAEDKYAGVCDMGDEGKYAAVVDIA